MNNMPAKLRKEMSEDPYFKKCCFTFEHTCSGKIEWHHNLIFGGKQVQDKRFIMPICQNVHDIARNIQVKEMLDLIMLSKLSNEEIRAISKGINYAQRLKYLKTKYNLKGQNTLKEE
jgi:hypothetical protein